MESTRIRELDFFTHKGVIYMCKARVGEMVIYNDQMVHESECVKHKEAFKLSSCFNKGAQMIARERMEQIEKHKFGPSCDDDYTEGELVQAALFALQSDDDFSMTLYPKGWQDWFAIKIFSKSWVERLSIAGALLAAEIDRLKRLEKSDNGQEGGQS